jgi:Ca-activated chloride channel family protein
MIVALARPTALITLPAQEGTVILTIDTSGSMQADDLKPSRMEAAKTAARAFVDKQPQGIQIGIVSFSDNAAIVQAPTDDKAALLDAINRLQPQRGTAIGRGLLASIDAINAAGNQEAASMNRRQFGVTPTPTPTPTPMPKGQYQPAIVVLLTDGENNLFPPPLQVIGQLADQGIRVYTVGIGSAAGVVLHIEGRSIRTRLDEPTLKEIAQATDAQYFNATNEQDLLSIYENLSTRLILKPQQQEITALFTAVAGIISLFAGILSLMWFNRLP